LNTIIICPNCHHEFELSEALTHELEEQIRKEHAEEIRELRQKAIEADDLKAKQEELLAEARHQTRMEMSEALLKEKELLFKEIEALKVSQMQSEEEKSLAIQKAIAIAKEEAAKQADAVMHKRIEEAKREALLAQQSELNRIRMQLDLAQKNVQQQQENFQEMLSQQKEQFETQKKENKAFFDQQLSQQKEMMERDIAQRERELVSRAKLESELQLKEQEDKIRKLTNQVNAMKETTEKKSQQLQGEALELLIEEKLMREPSFRFDSFSEVKKGANGVDVNMMVQTQRGESCGLIMIEAKRAANWSSGWIEKIKRDRIEAGVKEAVCLIVSTRLREDDILVDDLGDGVWATVPEYFIHFIQIIRKNMEDMHRVQKANIDRGDKKELLYNYVNSDAFRSKVKAMNDYHENIYSQGVKIQRSMKKMLDTIVKSKDMGDDIFIELGNGADIALIPGVDEGAELIDMKSEAHKKIE
jgi:hypothetical protein